MRNRSVLSWLGLVVAPGVARAGHKVVTVSMVPAEAPGTSLNKALSYRMTVSNA